jgi:NAD(P)-dependent dehydrogenase (short-subunit alcohol dehydrogenase family)
VPQLGPTSAPGAGRLDGSVTLVTGGSQGIGEAIVRLFAAEGSHIVFCARRDEPGISVEASVREAGGDATFVRCDVTDEAEVERLIAATVASHGALDIVVNAAGITESGSIEDFKVEAWRRMFEGNVTSSFLVCKYAVPHLRASRRAAVINLGSTYGFIGVPGSGAYAATKAAVISLTRTLALELASDGVRVNALCPGAVRTPLHLEWLDAQPDPEEALAKLTAVHPIGRISTPEEQARAALFLASDDASFVTGHTLLVDGGRTTQ